jgi:hypothetical protein
METTKNARKSAAAKQSKPDKRKPAPSQPVPLSRVMRFENPGQLTVPNQLSLGGDSRLYLTRFEAGRSSEDRPQAISVKESVAWFRLGHECNLILTKGEKFSDWLKSIEQALA